MFIFQVILIIFLSCSNSSLNEELFRRRVILKVTTVFSIFVCFATKMNRKEERMVVQRVRAMENTGMKQTKSVCQLL